MLYGFTPLITDAQSVNSLEAGCTRYLFWKWCMCSRLTHVTHSVLFHQHIVQKLLEYTVPRQSWKISPGVHWLIINHLSQSVEDTLLTTNDSFTRKTSVQTLYFAELPVSCQVLRFLKCLIFNHTVRIGRHVCHFSHDMNKSKEEKMSHCCTAK